MQLPDTPRGHLTKDQLQKNFPHAKIISSNTWHALFLSGFRKVQRFSVWVQATVSFRQNQSTISPVASLDPCSLFPLLIQSAAHSFGRAPSSVVTRLADAGSFCGGRATRGGQQGPAPPFGAVQHRPSHPEPPRGCPLACACCGTVAVA